MRFFVCAADEGIRVKASATTSFRSTECRSGELRDLPPFTTLWSAEAIKWELIN